MKINKIINIRYISHSIQSLLLIERMKAFITDIFMIYTPILYLWYIILGSKEAFQQNQFIIFICFLFYSFVISFLFSSKGQTFGYMYAEIKLIRDDGKNIGFLLSFFRFILFCFSMSLLFGFFVPFFNKKQKTFHDLITKTSVIHYKRH